jgi:hypothetical protein
MSMPDAGSDGLTFEMMGNVTTYVYDGNGGRIRCQEPIIRSLGPLPGRRHPLSQALRPRRVSL